MQLSLGSLLQVPTYAIAPDGEAAQRAEVERITAALVNLSHENLSRANLMAATGHDLKQPLQVLSMILETLESKRLDDDARKRALFAQTSIARIAAGLDDLASASRVGHAFATPRPRTFPVSDILQLISATWSQHAAHKGVQLRVAQCGAFVTSDVVMLTTIIGNLVGNAIKYAANGKVLVGCRRRQDDLTIQVLDSGCGIPNQHLKTIFDAFYQQTEASQGMGLGLSIVRSAAAALGHRLDVASKIGRGTVFSISVPFHPRNR
jgi:signal transduction histidine kinase